MKVKGTYGGTTIESPTSTVGETEVPLSCLFLYDGTVPADMSVNGKTATVNGAAVVFEITFFGISRADYIANHAAWTSQTIPFVLESVWSVTSNDPSLTADGISGDVIPLSNGAVATHGYSNLIPNFNAVAPASRQIVDGVTEYFVTNKDDTQTTPALSSRWPAAYLCVGKAMVVDVPSGLNGRSNRHLFFGGLSLLGSYESTFENAIFDPNFSEGVYGYQAITILN